jgi:membrane protein DedA with SNARE-associated domain
MQLRETWTVTSIIDWLGDALHPWGYVLLFALTVLEGSAFVGLFIPGESALLIAGFLANEGRLSLTACIGIAVIGAVIGDSVGYEIGRHFGPRLRSSWFGQRIGEARWQQAHDYIQRLGGRAIFLGRWVGVLRALVPALAGDARMPYHRFLFWNVMGAVVASPAVILGGYFAGSSFHVVEKWLGRATTGLALLVLVAFVIRHLVHRKRERSQGPAF